MSFFTRLFTSDEMPSRRKILNIRKMGTLPIRQEHIDTNIPVVINSMKKFPRSLELQQVCCRAISNMAMDFDTVTKVVDQRGHLLILEALGHHRNDWKLAWFGCSGIWNLSRSEYGRASFPPSVIGLLFTIAERHPNEAKVLNAVMGSFSNLALSDTFKQRIGTATNIRNIFAITNANCTCDIVAPTCAGLIANLAVQDPIADTLVNLGGLRLLARILRSQFRGAFLERNIPAALNNCMSSPLFFMECMKNKLIEPLIDLREHSADIASVSLTVNCLASLGVDANEFTTTLHVVCLNGLYDVLKCLMTDMTNLESQDNEGRTLLDCAIIADDVRCVMFLIKCGACTRHLTFEQLTPINQSAISESQFELKIIRAKFTDFLKGCITHAAVNHDVCEAIMSYVSTYSITQKYIH